LPYLIGSKDTPKFTVRCLFQIPHFRKHSLFELQWMDEYWPQDEIYDLFKNNMVARTGDEIALAREIR
jgi:hypothetical protein